MPLGPEDLTRMAAALRFVLDSATDPTSPGRLRVDLVQRLGPEESHRLRALLHQVVTAAEENLPTALRRVNPLTPEVLRRLSAELAESRGWSGAAAERTTRVWVAALGRDDLAHAPWPSPPGASRPGVEPPPQPLPLGVTAAPPGMPPANPGPANAARAAAPPVRVAPPAPPASDSRWPRTPKQLAAHTHDRSGQPARGVVLAYGGMNLALCVLLVLLLLTVLVIPVLVWDVSGLLLPVVGTLLASVLVRSLGRGALVATDGGVEFTPYDQLMRHPRPEHGFAAPWSEVSVTEGFVSVVRLAGHRVQVGPRNRTFAQLAAAASGGRG
ncbi:hypothetical protein [Nocardioides terrigena]|uniref:hypothetical protein n=1 Tax=Nocardioides terrigena TaxID=424797 RepID=UPI00131EE518|nr:hypothetical protein [Nocardioides terrigena]